MRRRAGVRQAIKQCVSEVRRVIVSAFVWWLFIKLEIGNIRIKGNSLTIVTRPATV